MPCDEPAPPGIASDRVTVGVIFASCIYIATEQQNVGVQVHLVYLASAHGRLGALQDPQLVQGLSAGTAGLGLCRKAVALQQLLHRVQAQGRPGKHMHVRPVRIRRSARCC